MFFRRFFPQKTLICSLFCSLVLGTKNQPENTNTKHFLCLFLQVTTPSFQSRPSQAVIHQKFGVATENRCSSENRCPAPHPRFLCMREFVKSHLSSPRRKFLKIWCRDQPAFCASENLVKFHLIFRIFGVVTNPLSVHQKILEISPNFPKIRCRLGACVVTNPLTVHQKIW